MEKMIWSKPEMNEFAFAANDYVAACGDAFTIYKFICNAGFGGKWHTREQCWCGEPHIFPWYEKKHEYSVYKDDGTQVGYHYSPCGTTHEVKVNKGTDVSSIFFEGWMDDNGTTAKEHDEVMIWRGEDGNNCHCMDALNVNDIETAKS